MKICQINSVYADGSTGKITQDIHRALLADGFDSFVLAGISGNTSDPHVYGISSVIMSKLTTLYRRISGDSLGGALFQTKKIIRIIKREKPDVIHLQCINGGNINACRLLRYLAKYNIKTVLTLHAEFMYSGGCEHAYDCEKWKTGCRCDSKCVRVKSWFFNRTDYTWQKMKRSMDKFKPENIYITAVSPWLLSRAKQSPMLERFFMKPVFNAVNTEIMHPVNPLDGVMAFRENDKKILLHITADFNMSNTLKGGKHILKLAEKLKNQNIQILVASNFGNPDGLPDNITFLGKISDPARLAQFYSLADLSVVVSKRETFNMPVAESLCCGTPVVGFVAGGPESIALPDYSEFVDYGDTDKLCSAVLDWIHKKSDGGKDYTYKIFSSARDVYDKAVITNQYEQLYTELTK